MSSSRSWLIETASSCQTANDIASTHCRSSRTSTVGAAAHRPTTKGRLSDARLALDRDNRSLATAEGFYGCTENYKLIFAPH